MNIIVNVYLKITFKTHESIVNQIMLSDPAFT